MNFQDAWLKKLKFFFIGKLSSWFYLGYILLILGTYTCMSFWAQSKFPSEYSILNDMISAQGGLTSNPNGYKIWNISMICLGFTLMPYFQFIYQNLKKTSPTFTKYTNALCILASVSLTFVGIFPRELILPHAIPAAIALYGFFFAFNMYNLILIERKLKFKEIAPRSWKFLFIIFLLELSVLGNIIRGIIIAINPSFSLLGIDSRLFSYPPWQWSIFISLFVWMFGIWFVISYIQKDEIK